MEEVLISILSIIFIASLVMSSLFIESLSDDERIDYPRIEEAVSLCEKNDGVNFIELDPGQFDVHCINGAVFTLNALKNK